MTNWYKAAPTFAGKDNALRVDRENSVLYNIPLFQSGVVALGHGVMGDEITAARFAQLGNKRPQGIKSRLSHPGMSEDGTGRQVARIQNLRIRDDKVIGDAHFLDSARRSPNFTNDPVEYLLDFADESPEDMGMSVVFEGTAVYIKDDGEEVDTRDFNNEFEPVNEIPIIRPYNLSAADFVDEPAANRDGMLSLSHGFDQSAFFAGYSSEKAEEAFAMLDNLLVNMNMTPDKAYQFAMRYFAARLRESRQERANLAYASVLESLTK